ncbi:MAG: bifunctional precorrin-2 dehydrogenase/sirohydrochlorin ferrochelatase [Actinomycetes bacterium]
MSELAQLSVQLQVRGRRCVVVGGGPVALRRTLALLQAGAQVQLIALSVHPDLRAAADRGELQIQLRGFEPADLEPADLEPADHEPPDSAGSRNSDSILLVVVATDDPEVNDQVGALCAAAGILVNRADHAGAGNLSFPATIQRGPVALAVSNSAGIPALSQWVAERVDTSLDQVLGLTAEQVEQLTVVLSQVRVELAEARTQATDHRRDVTSGIPDWRSALDETILVLVRMGRYTEAKERLLACLSS